MAIPFIGYQGMIAQKMDRQKRMIVDYIAIKEPKDTKPAPKEKKPIVVETPKAELSPEILIAPSKANPGAVKSGINKDASRELAIKQARIMSTKYYVNYYQLIREKVRQRLKDKYRSYYGEGDVSLVFDLRADGSLISVKAAPDTDAPARDPVLLDMAIQSLREAAPFAPFPRALSLPRMSFTLTVSFKKQ